MSEECNTLHQWFNGLKKFRFPYDEKEIPKNGIYVLFEKGERAHGTNRIVRFGTHKRQNGLSKRLDEHFLVKNKDRSIVRKHLGRVFLNRQKDSFLKMWELDLTSKNNREQYSKIVDLKKKDEIEHKITEYIQNNFWFVVFGVNDVQKRKYFEKKLISTVSLCQDCGPSENWLGKFCPNSEFHSKKKYRGLLKLSKSGLWNVHHLENEKLLLNEEDMAELRELIKIE